MKRKHTEIQHSYHIFSRVSLNLLKQLLKKDILFEVGQRKCYHPLTSHIWSKLHNKTKWIYKIVSLSNNNCYICKSILYIKPNYYYGTELVYQCIDI